MSKSFVYFATLSILWVAFAFSPQEQQAWKFEKKYAVKFFNHSVAGEFTLFQGNVIFDSVDLTKSSFQLQVDPTSVNTGNKMQNGHIQQKDWLDSKSFPSIDFTSSSFVKMAKGYEVIGEMQMHGVKRVIKIPFTFNQAKKKAILNASFSFNRFDYGIGNPKDGVDSVLTIEVTLPLKK